MRALERTAECKESGKFALVYLIFGNSLRQGLGKELYCKLLAITLWLVVYQGRSI